jgi:hypothetical protein
MFKQYAASGLSPEDVFQLDVILVLNLDIVLVVFNLEIYNTVIIRNPDCRYLDEW